MQRNTTGGLIHILYELNEEERKQCGRIVHRISNEPQFQGEAGEAKIIRGNLSQHLKL
jgi:hypothetical protein